MLLWIILGTLMNCVILFFFTRFFSVKFLKNFIILNFIISLILTIFCFIEIGYFSELSYLYLFNWVNIGIMKINLVLLYDTLTIVMIFVVLFISGLVHLYSFSYMRFDPNFFRFIAYLSLFTFFMLVLVTSNNFLQLLIGWEGVGLSSYLLICFWYTRIAANLAAIKAMSVNRIGDIFLLFTIFLIFSFFGSINFGVIFNNVIYLLDFYFDLFFIEICFIDLLCFFIFLAACGKSAQLLLHIWLPDAMEGPTPVSALIHAATMVTAGVFLVIRCSILFEHSSKILFFMVFFGSLTCFLMSILGAFQQDIKKIVAYSTCSQLGYMFMGCGLSSYNTSFFHLFNHSFFKALLFLSMGVIIHALADEQDLRKMGNLVNFLPYTIVIVFFGNFALLGLPFLAGFYSKDILIEVAFARFYLDGSFAYLLGLFAAFFTAFYSTRLFIRIFFSYSNFNRHTIFNINEVDILMFVPLIILLLCSFFVGFFFFDIFIGFGSFFFFDSIFINFINYSGISFEFESLINLFSFSKIFIKNDLYLNNYVDFDLSKTFTNLKFKKKDENLIILNETTDTILNLFKETYVNSDLFYEKLEDYKLIKKNTDTIVNSKEFFKNTDLNKIYAIITISLKAILYKKNIEYNKIFLDFNFLWNYNYDFYGNFIWDKINIQINLFIKILPLVISLLGFYVYYFLDDRYILFYHNYYYRLVVLKFYNGFFFDKLFIDVLLSKFYLFSYHSFYKNIESSFFQKYNIYIFEKNVFSFYFFFKIFSKGYFFVYILIVCCFIYFYWFLFFILQILNYSFISLIIILFIFCFVTKWLILKNYIKDFLMKNLNNN